MTNVLLTLVGCVVFVAITFFEQLPVLGWLGWVLSFGAWWLLARATSGPIPAGVLGAITGFVGALTSWMAQTGNLFGFTTPPGDRFGALFGFIGSSLGIVYWPLVGVGVCVVARLVTSGRSVRPY
ncbi:MAG TPA: hypothetical protein VFM93_08855 [Candidatus Limnocylindria bacterium]|nr:hypothetical protein [Candidatus Limnocylindria bacterium]